MDEFFFIYLQKVRMKIFAREWMVWRPMGHRWEAQQKKVPMAEGGPRILLYIKCPGPTLLKVQHYMSGQGYTLCALDPTPPSNCIATRGTPVGPLGNGSGSGAWASHSDVTSQCPFTARELAGIPPRQKKRKKQKKKNLGFWDHFFWIFFLRSKIIFN